MKSLIFKGRKGYYMALIRGNEELNESKLKAALQDQTLVMATPQEVLDLLGVPIRFVGPIGLPKEVTIIADHNKGSEKRGLWSVERGIPLFRRSSRTRLQDQFLARSKKWSPKEIPARNAGHP